MGGFFLNPLHIAGAVGRAGRGMMRGQDNGDDDATQPAHDQQQARPEPEHTEYPTRISIYLYFKRFEC